MLDTWQRFYNTTVYSVQHRIMSISKFAYARIKDLTKVVLYRSVLECQSVVCEFDGCFVLIEFGLRGSVFRVASIYAPNCNPDRDAFLVRCVDSIDPAVPTLLCGDFNTVLDRVWDHRGSCPFDVSRESSALLSALFSDCCVVDIWRERHPYDSAFTWFPPDGALASRIDLIGCLYAWVPYVSSVDILPCPFSDRCALSFSWALPNSVPPGLIFLFWMRPSISTSSQLFGPIGSLVSLLFLLSLGGGTAANPILSVLVLIIVLIMVKVK